MAFITPITLIASTRWSSSRCLPALGNARLAPGRARCAAKLYRAAIMQVSVGSELPSFTLPTDGNGTLSTEDLSKGTTILYFYPRDATPGCTCEAQDFRDFMPQLNELGVKVVGASKDSVESHDAFVKDLSINFPLISDDGTLSEAFGVWKLRQKFGKEFMGIERSTFIIKDGKIVKEWRGMKADSHASEVVEAVKQM